MDQVKMYIYMYLYVYTYFLLNMGIFLCYVSLLEGI